MFFLFVSCWSILKVFMELVSEGHPYSLIPLCIFHTLICIGMYFPVSTEEKRGCWSRAVDRIFPVDEDVMNLSEPLKSCEKGIQVGECCYDIGVNSFPSMREKTIYGVQKGEIQHAKSW